VATAYLSDLTDQGLTSAMLTAFAALNESFEVARNTVVTKVETRDTKAQEHPVRLRLTLLWKRGILEKKITSTFGQLLLMLYGLELHIR